ALSISARAATWDRRSWSAYVPAAVFTASSLGSRSLGRCLRPAIKFNSTAKMSARSPAPLLFPAHRQICRSPWDIFAAKWLNPGKNSISEVSKRRSANSRLLNLLRLRINLWPTKKTRDSQLPTDVCSHQKVNVAGTRRKRLGRLSNLQHRKRPPRKYRHLPRSLLNLAPRRMRLPPRPKPSNRNRP